MKTFTESDRREIEQRIQAVCGCTSFEGPKPDFLIRPGQVWPKTIMADCTDQKTPHHHHLLTASNGGITPFGVLGCN